MSLLWITLDTVLSISSGLLFNPRSYQAIFIPYLYCSLATTSIFATCIPIIHWHGRHSSCIYQLIEAEWCIYALLNQAIICSNNGLSPVGCQAVYSNDPFKFRWSRWYICNSSYYQHQIRSTKLSHRRHFVRGCVPEVVVLSYSVTCFIQIHIHVPIAMVHSMVCANDLGIARLFLCISHYIISLYRLD